MSRGLISSPTLGCLPADLLSVSSKFLGCLWELKAYDCYLAGMMGCGPAGALICTGFADHLNSDSEGEAMPKSSKGQSFITRLSFTGEKSAERLTLSMYLDVRDPSHRFFVYLWTEGATTILMDHSRPDPGLSGNMKPSTNWRKWMWKDIFLITTDELGDFCLQDPEVVYPHPSAGR
ncbi:hypothetical protein BXZ70DRAFT_1081249 [Cristinia sonorae]|uniref:Uncharacterized protein n=1 Tax=Cristinia sonorae TaxID=1940300 RepID=A0A8K0UD74_9AGAR|nr:hypothetical protein BXZ70DRAFT_1081249 [Cristinia sonorae]